MPNNAGHHGWAAEKMLNVRYVQTASNSLVQTFCFQRELYFLCFFFQKLKQKYSPFILLPLINCDIILQESRVTFYFSVFNKKKKTVLKKVSEQVSCCLQSNQMYVSRNSTRTFESNIFKIIFLFSSKLLCFYSIQGMNYYK